jgi:hypothetical protein
MGAAALAAVTFSAVTTLASVVGSASPAAAAGYTKGDLFVSRGDGHVEERTPSGALVQTLNSGKAFPSSSGSAFDPTTGTFYVTEFGNQSVSKYNNLGTFVGNFGSGYNSDPESVLVDKSSNVWVGQADGTHHILKFSPSGTLLQTFSPAVGPRGTDWIDLAADQCTMHYTSEGNVVKAFNVCTNTQLPDFATGLPNPNAYAHRILPDGGELVANSDRVVRLNSSGAVVQTYLPSTPESVLFALNLDPDGTSFWTADLNTGDIYHFNITTGAQLGTFSEHGVVPGLSIFGELCASCHHGGSGAGNIFEVTFTQCTNLHVGYNRFPDGTTVHWSVTSNGFGTVDSGQFTATGGGKLGSKTYHFLNIPLTTALHPEPVQSHAHFTWTIGSTTTHYDVTRDPGC